MRQLPASWIVLAFAVVLSGSPRLQPASATDVRGPEQTLMEWDAEFDRLTAEKGLEGFLAFIADDAAFFPAGGHISVGPQAARAIWGELLTTPGVSIRWKPLKAEMARSGELGYTFGTYALRQTGPAGEEKVSFGKYVTIWRKDKDGVWKVAADIGTPSPAPEAKSTE